MNPLWITRMARLVRNPPSRRRVMLVCAVVGAAALLIGFETIWGWPDWLRVNDVRQRGIGIGSPVSLD